MNKEQHAVNDLLVKIRELLGRFACKDFADDGACRKTNVLTKYNKRERNKVAFQFHTQDKISVLVVFDLNKTSEEYIFNMVNGVATHISDKRKERSKSIIRIATSEQINAVAGSRV